MYKLLFRETGTENWSDGPEFTDEALTPDARDILVDRYARYGLETRFEKLTGGERNEHR